MNKNCGSGVTERLNYEDWCWNDHISDKTTYHQITALEATIQQAATPLKMERAIKTQAHNCRSMRNIFKAALAKNDYKTARFYVLKKTKNRGIINNDGTFLQEPSRWAGIQINKFSKDLESRLADSFEMLQIMQDFVKQHGPLPHYARLIDADVNTIYPCLETDDCITSLQLRTVTYPE